MTAECVPRNFSPIVVSQQQAQFPFECSVPSWDFQGRTEAGILKHEKLHGRALSVSDEKRRMTTTW